MGSPSRPSKRGASQFLYAFRAAKIDGSRGILYLFSVLPASCRQKETMGVRKSCRRDAGTTLERHHTAPLNRYWDLSHGGSDPIVARRVATFEIGEHRGPRPSLRD